MIWGVSTATFTLVHVLISLVALGAGLVMLAGLLMGQMYRRWSAVFLITIGLTCLTGFGFPTEQVTPAQVVGVICSALVALAAFALYRFQLRGGWRRTYVASATTALYLNTFVAVVQSFQKVPALKGLAPTQSEAPFIIAQTTVLVLFAAMGILASIRFRETRLQAAYAQAGR